MINQDITTFNSKVIMPSEKLFPYIQCYIYTEVEGKTDEFYVDLFPVGYCVISINLNDDGMIYIDGQTIVSKANLTGQLKQHYKMKVKNVTNLFYILFKPLGTYYLFNTPQNQLACKFTDITTLKFLNYTEFNTQQLTSKSKQVNLMVNHINEWLISLIKEEKTTKNDTIVQSIIEYIKTEEKKNLLKDIYKIFKISKSSLERHFKQKLGLTPKEYVNFVRFNKSYELIKNEKYQLWSKIVYDNGYFDQSHFIKEFKKMYGYTPSQLYKSVTNIASHLKEKISA